MQLLHCHAYSPSSGDYPRLASILVDKAGSGDEFTRLTALQWLKELLGLAPPLALVGCYPDALEAVLPNVSHASKDIQQAALVSE